MRSVALGVSFSGFMARLGSSHGVFLLESRVRKVSASFLPRGVAGGLAGGGGDYDQVILWIVMHFPYGLFHFWPNGPLLGRDGFFIS